MGLRERAGSYATLRKKTSARELGARGEVCEMAFALVVRDLHPDLRGRLFRRGSHARG